MKQYPEKFYFRHINISRIVIDFKEPLNSLTGIWDDPVLRFRFVGNRENVLSFEDHVIALDLPIKKVKRFHYEVPISSLSHLVYILAGLIEFEFIMMMDRNGNPHSTWKHLVPRSNVFRGQREEFNRKSLDLLSREVQRGAIAIIDQLRDYYNDHQALIDINISPVTVIVNKLFDDQQNSGTPSVKDIIARVKSKKKTTQSNDDYFGIM